MRKRDHLRSASTISIFSQCALEAIGASRCVKFERLQLSQKAPLRAEIKFERHGHNV